MDEKNKIARLEKEILRLREELITDELTKARNRKGFFELLNPIVSEVLYQLERPHKRKNVVIKHLSVIFSDIDNFKKINDSYGHLIGDVVLRAVAKIFIDHTRGIDVVGRYGGEELAIGLIGADREDAIQIAESLRERVESLKIEDRSKKIRVTASFGVATLAVGDTLLSLVNRADEAMYQAKKQGKNRVVALAKG